MKKLTKEEEQTIKRSKETPAQRKERVAEEGGRFRSKVIPDKRRDKKDKASRNDYDER
mgnify:CR=1 FL=1